MTPRQRRMMADYQKIQEDFSNSPFVKIDIIGPANPPEKYRITFNLPGLRVISGQIIEVKDHIAEIYLDNNYPREKPKSTLITPIWHPNFGSYICIGDHWAAGETLSDIIIQIADMIQYKVYNPKSPLNAQAAKWAVENRNLFPISNIDIMQPQVDIEIELGDLISHQDDNDIDIEFK